MTGSNVWTVQTLQAGFGHELVDELAIEQLSCRVDNGVPTYLLRAPDASHMLALGELNSLCVILCPRTIEDMHDLTVHCLAL